MNRKRFFINGALFSLSTIIIIVAFEFATRTLLWSISGNISIWAYGINPDIGIQVFDLSDLNINIYNDSTRLQEKENNTSRVNAESGAGNIEVWVFGGSTTAGYSCSPHASSWPEELGKLMPEWTVRNFGRSGTNSDFAFRTLASKLNDHTPDWVLWANRVNEVDVITLGLDRNKSKLAQIEKAEVNKFGKTLLYLHRTDKTFKKYSSFYFMLHDLIQRIRWKLGYRGRNKKPILSQHNMTIALKNYAINTEDMIKLSESNNFRVGLVTLVIAKELSKEQNLTEWDQMFLKKVGQLATQTNAYWIDTRDYKYSYEKPDKLICDGAHQTLEGNRQIAKAISKKLLDAISNRKTR